jgi:hypothetical protein
MTLMSVFWDEGALNLNGPRKKQVYPERRVHRHLATHQTVPRPPRPAVTSGCAPLREVTVGACDLPFYTTVFPLLESPLLAEKPSRGLASS